MSKYIIHTQMHEAGIFGSIKVIGDTPSHALARAMLKHPNINPVAWSLDPVAWSLDPVAWSLDPVAAVRQLRIEAMQVGRLIVDGKVQYPMPPAIPKGWDKVDTSTNDKLHDALVAAKNDDMVKRDGPPKPHVRTPGPIVPVSSVKPCPWGASVNRPDMHPASHLVDPRHASAAALA